LNQLNSKKIKALHDQKRAAIQKRLAEFASVPESEYFYELIYCLLTPQSSAENALKVVQTLQEGGLKEKNIDPEPFLRNKKSYIRFHKQKAKYIIEVKNQYPSIFKHLVDNKSSVDIRSWLVKNVRGLGWKEASHFLRNIGHRNLAILDRHILKNLLRLGIIKQLPRTLTANQYRSIEEKFQKFGTKIRIPIDELDLLFWSMETGEILK
jgi:N-glycosylase/DNA lyase